jgi:hypothetical protein
LFRPEGLRRHKRPIPKHCFASSLALQALWHSGFYIPDYPYGNAARVDVAHGAPLEKPRQVVGFFCYLLSLAVPAVEVAKEFREDVRRPGRAAAGPVFLQVGTTFVEPTEVGYDPTEGATTDPYPSVPEVCASAIVLVRVSAVASAIVVIFMVVSFTFR